MKTQHYARNADQGFSTLLLKASLWALIAVLLFGIYRYRYGPASAEYISDVIKECAGVSTFVANAEKPISHIEIRSMQQDCTDELSAKKEAEAGALVLQAQKKALNN